MAERTPEAAALEARLVDLGEHLAFPGAPNLAGTVVRRLTGAPPPRSRLPWTAWLPAARPVRRALLVATALLLVAAAVAAAIGLGLPGLRIVLLPAEATLPPVATPSASAPGLGGPLGLGVATDLADAERIVGFRPRIPSDAVVGAPDEVRVLNRLLTLVWAASDDLPPLEGAPRIGLLVTELEGTVDDGYFEKLAIEGSSEVTNVDVDGSPGWWITGEPHRIVYRLPSGEYVEESRRPVGDVLIWRRDGLTLRIESSLGRDATIRLAESMGG